LPFRQAADNELDNGILGDLVVDRGDGGIIRAIPAIAYMNDWISQYKPGGRAGPRQSR